MISSIVPLSVNLYDVDTVVVDPSARLAHLNTEWDQTELVIDLTKHQGEQQEYYFDIGGFQHSKIVFLADDDDDDVQDDDDDADDVSVQELYLVLVVCVSILCLGVCSIVLVLSYTTQPHVYFDSVTQTSNDPPLYSVVDKSKKQIKKTQAMPEKQEQKNEEQEIRQKSDSFYEILSTLQFKSKQKSGNKTLEKKRYSSSFFYQNTSSDSSGNYDLTLGGATRQVQVEVHHESFTDSLENDSDVANNKNVNHTLYENTKYDQQFYSFRKLQEKFRNIIERSRVGQ